jgi:hypothetical protein
MTGAVEFADDSELLPFLVDDIYDLSISSMILRDPPSASSRLQRMFSDSNAMAVTVSLTCICSYMCTLLQVLTQPLGCASTLSTLPSTTAANLRRSSLDCPCLSPPESTG